MMVRRLTQQSSDKAAAFEEDKLRGRLLSPDCTTKSLYHTLEDACEQGLRTAPTIGARCKSMVVVEADFMFGDHAWTKDH